MCFYKIFAYVQRIMITGYAFRYLKEIVFTE